MSLRTALRAFDASTATATRRPRFTNKVTLAALSLALCCASACRYRPTQITLLVDGDSPSSRPATLTVATLDGLATYEQLRAAIATPSATLTSAPTQPLFGNTFSLIPKTGAPRAGAVSMLAIYDAPATESEPALHIERMHQMAFVERVPQQGYLHFATACGARATDCAPSVAPEECTVWRRCLEQGATCGDNGECTRWDLPLAAVPVGTMLDSSTALDARVSRLDGAADDADAGMDASIELDASDSGDVATDAPAPIVARLVAPLTASVMTGRRPRLRWSPPPEALSMEVEACRDRMMTTGCQRFAAMSASGLQVPTELDPGAWFWRVHTTSSRETSASAIWMFRIVGNAGVAIDTTCLSELDYNADGLSDMVIGAPATNNGSGTVSFVRSTPGGTMPLTSVMGGAMFRQIGASLAGAGDFNGDGQADAVLGSPNSDPGGRANAGTIRVHFGGSLNGETWSFDGETASDALGRVVDGAGDIDGDGYSDVIASVPSADSMLAADVGGFVVYYGAPSNSALRAPTVVRGTVAMQGFAVSVAGAGDVNGDGFADVVVGANLAANGAMTNAGFAQIYLGSSAGLLTTPAVTWSGQSTNERFGITVAPAGDVNGDGYCDVLIGSTAAMANNGLFRVFHGASTLPTAAASTINGTFGAANFAGSLSSAGDVNGDGFADVLVGASRAAPPGRVDAGSIAIYYGGTLGVSPTVATRIDGVAAGDLFGRAVSSGNFNNDQFSDVFIGAPGSSMQSGSVFVFAGSATGLLLAPARTLNGSAPGAQFGTALSM